MKNLKIYFISLLFLLSCIGCNTDIIDDLEKSSNLKIAFVGDEFGNFSASITSGHIMKRESDPLKFYQIPNNIAENIKQEITSLFRPRFLSIVPEIENYSIQDTVIIQYSLGQQYNYLLIRQNVDSIAIMKEVFILDNYRSGYTYTIKNGYLSEKIIPSIHELYQKRKTLVAEPFILEKTSGFSFSWDVVFIVALVLIFMGIGTFFWTRKVMGVTYKVFGFAKEWPDSKKREYVWVVFILTILSVIFGIFVFQ